jgi:hypothetical protein
VGEVDGRGLGLGCWAGSRGGEGDGVVGGGRKSGGERRERKVGLRGGGDADDSGHSRRYDLSQCTQKFGNRFSRKTDVRAGSWEPGVA